MEWYETRELRNWVHDESLSVERKALITDFRRQLDDAIAESYISPEEFVRITADDCTSNVEVSERLKRIRDEVFGA